MIEEYEKYLKSDNPTEKEKGYAWYTAIGLQEVDGLKTSKYLNETAQKNISGDITFEEANALINSYYENKQNDDDRYEEADKVSLRIAKILLEKSFVFSPVEYINIHKRLFDGIYNHAGKIRDYDITKKEWVLNGDTVYYGSACSLIETLNYDFKQEKEFSYRGLSKTEIIKHLAMFVSNLWQVHIFGEGNTRTTAVFFIKYLRVLGYNVTNDIFAQNSWYFRNALVRANYTNVEKNIHETKEYLELFLKNLLLNENNELKNRYLHIDYNSEKPDIQSPVLDIDENLINSFNSNNRMHIRELFKKYSIDTYFGRTDIMNITGLSKSAASDLTKKMLQKNIIIPINGHGKGKYIFVIDRN